MLHLAGIAVQDIFDTLSEPAVEPDAEPLLLYDRAMKMLDDHFKFTPNTTFERHMFRQMAQRVGETTAQFANRLCQQAKLCNFHNEQEDMRNLLVERVTDDKLRKKFLEKRAGLSLASVLETARLYEATESSAKEMQQSGEKVLLVKRERAARSKPASVSGRGTCGFSGQGASRKECGNCGSWKHSAGSSMCSAKKTKCRKCGKIGHFERKCRSSSSSRRFFSADSRVLCRWRS